MAVLALLLPPTTMVPRLVVAADCRVEAAAEPTAAEALPAVTTFVDRMADVLDVDDMLLMKLSGTVVVAAAPSAKAVSEGKAAAAVGAAVVAAPCAAARRRTASKEMMVVV
jgi:hypothetical protein